MVEIAISVAAKIAEYLVAPVARPFSYLWNYKTNLENLKNEVEKLEAKRDTVELLIKDGEEPLPDVKLWQENVKKIIDEASEVGEDNHQQASMQCFKGFSCTKLMKRYQHSKIAAGKLKTDVVGLEQQGAQFKEVSSRANVPEETWIQSNKDYKDFDSRKSVLKNIIDALRNPDVNMVGIYGMGGVGKTTLAKEVARQAKQDNLFDVIVFVEVSKTQDIKKIQQEIGEKLGLKFQETTNNARARTLYQHLKNEVTASGGADNSASGGADNSKGKKKENKMILIILDNVWGKIELEMIGIPFGDDCKGLKLLLTTRNSDVLTNQMNSKCNFPIDALNETEAWSLFKSIAGTCDDCLDLNSSIALEVAKECGGMTIAIVTIARALKNKEECDWRYALQELKKPSSESFEGMTKEVYTCIKLSYDYLETTKLQKIFLLCSRMGHTYDASIQDLSRYGLGLGFFERSNTVEEALCEVKYLVKKLKENSLLIDAPNESKESADYGVPDDERFAMHDVVYDVARSIACGKENVCIVIDDAIPRFWANKNKLENCTSITLHNIDRLPKDRWLVCSQLEFFYMKTKDSFSRIPDDFFTEMPKLQVLHLIEMDLSPLPTSLSHLVNLQTLCLDKCKLGDISIIEKLEKLEILSFRGSKIEKLPEEMRQLTSIRLLDLTDCSTLKIIPPNVIPCFVQLEALYMYNTSIRWEVGGLNIGRRNAGLDELKRLHDDLTTLEICIPDARMSDGLLSSQLERYKISIGSDHNWKYPPKSSRTLRFKIKTNDNADGVISQLKGIKELELFGERWDDSMHSVSCDALSSLESLVLRYLNLEKICNDPLLADSFRQLRTIRVDRCNKLTNILSFSTDRVLPQLQEIQVSSCENMEDIFAIEREDDFNSTEVIHEIQFSQLHSMTLGNLPRFKSFCHRVKTASPLQLTSNTEDKIDIPKSLFNDEKVVFPNLQTLKIYSINHVEKIWHNLHPTMSYCVQNLTELILRGCDSLKELFSSSTGVTEESRKEDRRDSISFPKLNRLEIGHLAKLTRLWSGYYMEFPLLKKFEIFRCPALEAFIFDDKVACPNLQTLCISYIHVEKIWHSLPPKIFSCVQNLTKLTISDCGNLKELFSSSTGVMDEVREEEMRDPILFPKLNCLRIRKLEKLTTLWSGYHIKFPTLKEFRIESCPQLDAFIFNDKVAFPNLQTLHISRIPVEKIWHNLPPKISSCVQNLTTLTISKCGNLKELFSSSTVVTEESREEEMRDTILFPKLNCLRIQKLEKLTTLWSGYHIKFPTLKEFRIDGCPQLDAFIFDDKVRVPSLEIMQIWNMDNLKMIWHNQLDGDSFSKLKSLTVKTCDTLLTLFPSNICGRLLSLQELSVERCRSLKYLFAASNTVANDEYSPKFLFPKLTSLVLYELRELRSFYLGRHTVEGPVLKTLKLSDCFIHDTDEEGQTQMQQSLFFVEQAFPCLEELKLHGKNIMMMWQGQVLESLFVKLKILEVFFDYDSTNLPLCIIQRFQNLEKLSLKFSSYKEIFSNGEDQTQAPTPARIKTLHLWSLKDLKYMWKQDFKQLDLILQNLEGLHIYYCSSLINVMPPSASFQNLTVMVVRGCSSLINIGTSSAAKSLVQLTQMKIEWCDNIIEVVGNHGDVTEDEIIFPKLKSLSLEDLPSFTSFCCWNVTLQFPSLEELFVVRCPQMKIFSRGVLTTHTLREFKIEEESIELRPNVDINKAIQQFHEKVDKIMQRLNNELIKAKQQLDEEANVQSFIKDCEGSSSHLEIRGDPM